MDWGMSDSSRSSSPGMATPQIPSFRTEELKSSCLEPGQDTLRRKLFDNNDDCTGPGATVRANAWRESHGGSGAAPEQADLVQELARSRELLEKERSMTQKIVAERTSLREQVTKLQCDLQAARKQHELDDVAVHQMASHLAESKRREDAARLQVERLSAALGVLQASMASVVRNSGVARGHELPQDDVALAALKAGLSAVQAESIPPEMILAQASATQTDLEAITTNQERRNRWCPTQCWRGLMRLVPQRRQTIDRSLQEDPSLQHVQASLSELCSQMEKAAPSAAPRAEPGEQPSAAVPATLEAGRSERPAKPRWDGYYLSSPPTATARRSRNTAGSTPAREAMESPATGRQRLDDDDVAGSLDDGLPPPPNTKCWEWPLSKPEKQERVAMIEGQLWRYDQSGLIEQVEMLEGICAQHGLLPAAEEVSDDDSSIGSEESV
ncbi:hypothetical protein AK812_SmicGene38650 [Symbiodinium microadriaticum]|uniref:Uncharacterized protein n=1 Tax=Symbiodinium microadriaticum TaxID=2951 RepID=A0A1Q9CD68_SYMMI|nr:hypothetical protein AK812_SmicGene38650 [Symbiodinium microadriaticum]CAE7945899.1 unnamed protein product [Symbiodinium sp. KB8]